MSDATLLDKRGFNELAEATREAVQAIVVDQARIFDPTDTMPAHLAAQAFFAQLSGVISAAANGLAGLAPCTTTEILLNMLTGLHEQLDSAFEQGLRQKAGVAND